MREGNAIYKTVLDEGVFRVNRIRNILNSLERYFLFRGVNNSYYELAILSKYACREMLTTSWVIFRSQALSMSVNT